MNNQTNRFRLASTAMGLTLLMLAEGTAKAMADSPGPLSAGTSSLCGILQANGQVQCFGSSSPPSSTSFTSINSGPVTACGVTAGYPALGCWSSNTGTVLYSLPGPYYAASTGWDFFCGIDTDLFIHCFPPQNIYLNPPPSGVFSGISCGNLDCCAIAADRSITCWGQGKTERLYSVEVGIPQGQFIQVSLGQYNACALDVNLHVQCWGQGASGPMTTLPLPTSLYLNLSTNGFTTCAVRYDQQIICSGDNTSGQLNVPPGNYTQVTVDSSGFICGLLTNGHAQCWGNWGTYMWNYLVPNYTFGPPPTPPALPPSSSAPFPRFMIWLLAGMLAAAGATLVSARAKRPQASQIRT